MRLKHEFPGFKNKISVIDGDLNRPDLGITPEAMQQITNEVNIIFHSGASVRFNDNLKDGLKANTMGTREILKIARKMKNLKVKFSHLDLYNT